MIPFIDLEGGFLTTEELLFLAGASGGGGVEHTITNNPATFTTDMAKPLRKLLIPFTPVQAGSGDPSPQNIRPITGWTGLNITRTGKNLFDGQFPSLSSNIYYRHYFVGNSTVTGASNVPLTSQGYGNIFLLPGKTNTGASTGMNNITDGVSRTVNPVDGWVTIAYRNDNGVNPSEYNVQIEVGATATEYEPYSGTTIPVSWQSEAGEVYGGTLDALTGVLTVTHKFIDLTTVTGWVKSSSYPGGFYVNTSVFGIKAQTPFICTHAKSVNSISEYDYGTCFCDSSVNIRIMQSGSVLSDWEAYRQEQSQNGTPVCIVGELRESFTVQVSPISLSTLIGENVLWTDTNGDNTIVYLKKT